MAFFQERLELHQYARRRRYYGHYRGGLFPEESGAVAYFGGTAGGGASECPQLIASTIEFSGNSTFNNNCTGKGTKTISYTQGWLAE